MTKQPQKYRYTVSGWTKISVPTEAYFLAFNEYEARMMAQKAGIEAPKAIKMEPVGEHQS
jgi:hypothetical protein